MAYSTIEAESAKWCLTAGVPDNWITPQQAAERFFVDQNYIREHIMRSLVPEGKAIRAPLSRKRWLADPKAIEDYLTAGHRRAQYPLLYPWLQTHTFEATYWPYLWIAEAIATSGVATTENIVWRAIKELGIQRCAFGTVCYKKALRKYVVGWLHRNEWVVNNCENSTKARQYYEKGNHPPQFANDRFSEQFFCNLFYEARAVRQSLRVH